MEGNSVNDKRTIRENPEKKFKSPYSEDLDLDDYGVESA